MFVFKISKIHYVSLSIAFKEKFRKICSCTDINLSYQGKFFIGDGTLVHISLPFPYHNSSQKPLPSKIKALTLKTILDGTYIFCRGTEGFPVAYSWVVGLYSLYLLSVMGGKKTEKYLKMIKGKKQNKQGI